MYRSQKIGPVTIALASCSGRWTVAHHQDGETETHIRLMSNFWVALAYYRKLIRYAHDWLAFMENSAGDHI